METERTELAQLEVIAAQTTAVTITDKVKQALTQDLSPVLERMRGYTAFAAIVNIASQEDADRAAGVVAEIKKDLALVEKNDVLDGIVSGFNRLHKMSTAFRALFTEPMNRDLKKIRQPVLDWDAKKLREAQALAAKLQADADAKAAAQQAALLKKAESVKSPALQESYREQAAAVIAPTVTVEAPKSGMRTAKAWKVMSIERQSFFSAIADRPDLWGFVEVCETRLERSKAANPSMTVPGIMFKQIVR